MFPPLLGERAGVREVVPKLKFVLTLALTCFLSPGERTYARPSLENMCASALQNVPQQIEVLNYRGKNLTTKYTKRNLAAGWTCSVSSLLDPFRAGLEFKL
jgi:hypothetical protein